MPNPKHEAADHDARALLALSRSLRDNVVSLPRGEVSSHVVEAVEAMHAEVLRASHLVSTWAAMQRNYERPQVLTGHYERK
jgi:hypothetical protein